MAIILNLTRHLSSKLELYFRHQRRIAMQSFGTTLRHPKHHAFQFHSTAWVPPRARLCWLLCGPPRWGEHDSYLPGAPTGRADTYTSVYHEQNEPHQVLCVRIAQRWKKGHSSMETLEEGASGRHPRGGGVGAEPWRGWAFPKVRQREAFQVEGQESMSTQAFLRLHSLPSQKGHVLRLPRELSLSSSQLF